MRRMQSNGISLHRISLFGAFVVFTGLMSLASAQVPVKNPGDWPQWRGPDRTGQSRETGLLTSWPEGGPPVVWKSNDVGAAYSSVSVADGRVYTQGNVNDAETVLCLDEKTGEILWSVTHEGAPRAYRHRRGDGPRGSPTVDGDRVYVVAGNGDVSCFEVASGKSLWHRHFVKDFGGRVPSWGFSESPLIDGDHVIVTPGGPQGAIVALNKMNGEVVWKSKDVHDRAHYSSAIIAEVEGVRQIIQFTSDRVVGLDASDGRLLWSYRGSANRTANVCTPIYSDGHVFTSSAYGTGGGLVKLTKSGDKFEATEVYFEMSMANHHGGIVLVDGYLYGFGSNALICMNFLTGEIMWRNRSVGKGSLCYANGHLYCLGEEQSVGLVAANPKEYVEKGRFELPDSGKPSWAHPVVANGHLYLRDQSSLTCYDVRAK